MNRKDYLEYLQALLKHLKAEEEKSLKRFVIDAWDVLIRDPFIDNWHIGAICEHLEAVTRGEIRRLIINVPPGTCKSTLISQMWPVWCWVQNPALKFLNASHTAGLAIRDARKSRLLIESQWFSARWGDRVQMAKDQNQKSQYENTAGGYREAIGILAGATGKKGDIISIDDPHDARKTTSSDVERKKVIQSWIEGLSTRGSGVDPAFVLIMQRLHMEDLAGYLLKSGDWEHLCLPMEYEPARRCVCDPRTKPGELLWPEYFSVDRVLRAKATLGPYGTAGQLQQRPSPKTGGIIRDVGRLQRYTTLPNRDLWLRVIQSWDTAQKSDELKNDPSVCGTWIETANSYYLIDVYRDWKTQPELEGIMKDLAAKFQPNTILIEDKNSGSGLIQHARAKTVLPVIPVEPKGDKVFRMSNEAAAIEAGRVWIPEDAPWVQDYITELQNFPSCPHDDQVDMTSQFLKYVRENPMLQDDEVLNVYGEREATTNVFW